MPAEIKRPSDRAHSADGLSVARVVLENALEGIIHSLFGAFFSTERTVTEPVPGKGRAGAQLLQWPGIGRTLEAGELPW